MSFPVALFLGEFIIASPIIVIILIILIRSRDDKR